VRETIAPKFQIKNVSTNLDFKNKKNFSTNLDLLLAFMDLLHGSRSTLVLIKFGF
jgi:hypothetical protein